jgi:hypothetical protein
MDGATASTANVCHTFTTPGNYPVSLTITDSSGNFALYTANLAADVCDVPPVAMTVQPLGGTAPLNVSISANSVSPNRLINSIMTPTVQFNNGGAAQFTINVDQQAQNNYPNSGYAAFFNALNVPANTTTKVFFPGSGIFRVQAQVSNATSYGLTLPQAAGQAEATGFINVLDPNAKTVNDLIIILGANGVAPNPADDTIGGTGYVNLAGLTMSDLVGTEFTIALNGYDPIIDVFLDSNLQGTQGDAVTGKTGTLSLQYPSGAFTFSAKGNYATSLILTDLTEHQMVVEHFGVQIGNVFNSPGTEVTYNYQSIIGTTGHGSYKLGAIATFSRKGGTGLGAGSGGTKEVLVSGGFIVTAADLKLSGDVGNATISGYLAREGGDNLVPAATSDVIVDFGGFSESLNFSNTIGFKTKGKPPTAIFTYNNKKSGTAIQSLSWASMAGTFSIVINNMPNSAVGLNTTAGQQGIPLTFIVTPDNSQQFIGTTTFDVFKVSDTEFKHIP